MPIRRALHRLAIRAERVWDRIFPPAQTETPVLEPYRGYATPGTLVLRGRVLSHLRRGTPREGQSRWVNFRQMLALFFTAEVENVTVTATASGVSALSDEEGYVRLEIPRLPEDAGWVEVEAELAGGETECFPVMVPDPAADCGVISDIDDTMMHTGAHRLWLNLWTTFTGSPLTREVFADSIALMAALSHGGRNPVFYVSSSPWNLHGFLEAVFDRVGLPRGPLFLRDLGIAEDQFVTRGHGHHKGGAIDTILEANPGLGFYLLGDTGQKDAHVYLEAARRHPGRVRGVFLREPGRGPDAASRAALEEIAALGIETASAPDFHAVTLRLQAARRAAGR